VVGGKSSRGWWSAKRSGSTGKTDESFSGLFTQTPNAPAAIVLVHGVGVHPDHGVIGALRVSLADAGYTTLSIQMPVQKADAGVNDYYPAVFPEAVERNPRRGPGGWRQKGIRRTVLLSHSMGSWMSNVYYEGNFRRAVLPRGSAWV